jgi:type II secretory pathway pseudopilin PulG
MSNLPPVSGAPAAAPKTSGLAIASVVCGIVGLCTLGIGSIIGCILGIVALRRISRSGDRIGGRNLAIAGIIMTPCTFFVSLIFTGMLAALLLPAVGGAMDAANSVQSQNNTRALYKAVITYCMDNKDRLPPPDDWPTVLDPYLADKEHNLTDPSDPAGTRSYAMNAALNSMSMNMVLAPSRTVLFFECAPGSPPGGGRESLPLRPRHHKGYIIMFVDGHMEGVSPENLGQLIWDPKSNRP